MLTSSPIAADPCFGMLRDLEFGRLRANHHAYLDYAGSALYAESQIRAHRALLDEAIFGNPHSEHDPSRASAQVIDAARARVLRFVGAAPSTHVVCFTANATAAIKLVAESYPFGPSSSLVLAADNHNSVNGIREYARAAGAPVRYLPLDAELRLREPARSLAESARPGRGLFALPAQSNFSGVKHPLSLVAAAKAAGFDVLLDIAAFAPANVCDLTACPADFAVLSFYKLFGYPTGIGALIARRDALDRLRRPWFSGGTVLFASTGAASHRLRPLHEAFEDGTPDFLGLAGLEPGFVLIEAVTLPRLAAHVERLTRLMLEGLQDLCHPNGSDLVRIYGPRDITDRGGTVAFNVLDRRGRAIPFAKVEDRARRAGVSVRGGCFCNPGAAEAAFGFDPSSTRQCLDALADSFTVERFAACLGGDTAVGAVRASAGLATSDDDIGRLIDVIASFSADRTPSTC